MLRLAAEEKRGLEKRELVAVQCSGCPPLSGAHSMRPARDRSMNVSTHLRGYRSDV
jgi:hypothetical protein